MAYLASLPPEQTAAACAAIFTAPFLALWVIGDVVRIVRAEVRGR